MAICLWLAGYPIRVVVGNCCLRKKKGGSPEPDVPAGRSVHVQQLERDADARRLPYTYDNNGNLVSKTDGSGTTRYAWDFENRLASVTLPSGNAISFKYDPLGGRIYKSSPAGTTIYVHDGQNIIEELNGTGGVQERYTYGPGIDEPLVGQRQPKIFFYEADGLGTVTSLTDPTGAVAATYTYDSFGFLTNSTGSATNWFRYTARQFDSDTALYYYRARYYDPTIGRFISEDPIRFKGGINFYAYVRNSPIKLIDPSGLCAANGQQPITCDTVLPNGQTVGDVVRQQRAVLQNVLDSSIQANQAGAESDPLSALTGAFLFIAKPNGPIDFKNTFRGRANGGWPR
jgi:RHS repeat-associated protein